MVVVVVTLLLPTVAAVAVRHRHGAVVGLPAAAAAAGAAPLSLPPSSFPSALRAEEGKVDMGHASCKATLSYLQDFENALAAATCEDGGDKAERLAATRSAIKTLHAAKTDNTCVINEPSRAVVVTALSIADPTHLCVQSSKGTYSPTKNGPPPRKGPSKSTAALDESLFSYSKHAPACCADYTPCGHLCCRDTCLTMVGLFGTWMKLEDCCGVAFKYPLPSKKCSNEVVYAVAP